MNAALDDGIREQHKKLALRIAGGMLRAGWKICINDRRMQKKLGLEGSFVGFLDGSHALASGDVWNVEQGSVLGVEPEFAIRFACDVAASDDRDAVRSAIAGVAPALEVVDWRDAKFDLATLAAGSSFHAGFVTGELGRLEDVPAIVADPANPPGCPRLEREADGEILGVPDAELVPADLVGLVQHVAAFLSHFGQSIRSGDWLLCGACTNPARVEPGHTVRADFATLGAVCVTFSS